MRAIRFWTMFFLGLVMLAGCEQPGSTGQGEAAQQAAPTKSDPVVSETETEVVEIDTNRFIRAAKLHERMQSDQLLYVFDVRAKTSFDKSHIRGALHMPYGKVEATEVAALSGMTPDTPIVTYCGCPHHLSGIAADQLIEWGYRNVRVLYEGFWHWRDHHYPLAALGNPPTQELAFSGRIVDGKRPLAHVDVFIRNLRNGQLEAAATDADGRFQTGFHVYDYQSDDLFELLIGSLDAGVAAHLAPQRDVTEVVIQVPSGSG